MASKVTVSAPGKLMLLGEHAVVYGRPCIVTAMGQRMTMTVTMVDERTLTIDAPEVKVAGYVKPMDQLGEGDIPNGARFVEIAVKNFLAKHPFEKGLKIETSSEFTSTFGFGSSSASTVCVMKALDALMGTALPAKALFELAYQTVLDIQGKGSGFDVAAAIFGGTLYFVTGGKIIEPLGVTHLPLVVGYTGIKADTVTIVNEVLEKAKKDPKFIEGIYDRIAVITEKGKDAFVHGEWEAFGALMNEDQEELAKLGVSNPILDAMISGALHGGAYGAKLSGAGRGDCMIAVCSADTEESVKEGIREAGGQVLDVDANVEGVRVES